MVVDKVSDRDSITDLVCKNVDGAKHRRTHGKELAYTLPLEEVGSFKSRFIANWISKNMFMIFGFSSLLSFT